MHSAANFRGVAAIELYADDLEKAGRWYSELLQQSPYFKMLDYVEFRIGEMETELYIVKRPERENGSLSPQAGGAIFWQVQNFQTVLDELLRMGARIIQPVFDRSQGQGKQITVVLRDPFGNKIGITKNDHFTAVHEALLQKVPALPENE